MARRYNVLVGVCWKRSQFVLTANWRSLPWIELQIGSPSTFTRTAGVLLKKIGGGSAFTPSTFFGMIWLLSRLASTRSRARTRSSAEWPPEISAHRRSDLIPLERGEVANR